MSENKKFPGNLIGRLVKVTYLNPSKTRLNEQELLRGGTLMKVHEDGLRVLILNPECESLDDMVGFNTNRIKERFKWSSWVDLSEAKIEQLYTDEEFLEIEQRVLQNIKNHWRGP